MTLPVSQHFVERYLAKWGSLLLRAKGYLMIGAKHESFVMQFAGKRTNWQQTTFQGTPYLVLIGMDLDAKTLEDDWQKRLTESQL